MSRQLTGLPGIGSTGDCGEAMADAKQAAAALRLPYYWFADSSMRAKYRIPHYLLGGLVRYRMSELSDWAAKAKALPGRNTPGAGGIDEGAA